MVGVSLSSACQRDVHQDVTVEVSKSISSCAHESNARRKGRTWITSASPGRRRLDTSAGKSSRTYWTSSSPEVSREQTGLSGTKASRRMATGPSRRAKVLTLCEHDLRLASYFGHCNACCKGGVPRKSDAQGLLDVVVQHDRCCILSGMQQPGLRAGTKPPTQEKYRYMSYSDHR